LGCSYRFIAGSFAKRPDGIQIIKAGTVNRIAKSKGAWIPKDCEILIALGLKKPRKPRTQIQEAILAMSQMARQGLRMWKRGRQ